MPAHEPQPHAPERYPARNAVKRGIGWCRVATRYDQYAPLGFLYVAAAWIWLKSYINTA